MALAQYSAEAAEEAAEKPEGRKLKEARRVRDVAAIHSTLWPAEKHSSLLSLILTGSVPVEKESEPA